MDAGAESTAEQTVKKKRAVSKQEKAAVAAAPSDPQKVKQGERPKQEARKERRSGEEVRKRKPAVAATSQAQTVIDGTARRGRDAQRKDLSSGDGSSSGSTSDSCSSDHSCRVREWVSSPSPTYFQHEYWTEEPTVRRHRGERRSGGHGKDDKRRTVILKTKERAAPRTKGSTDMVSSGGEGNAVHMSYRKRGKDNSRRKSREPFSCIPPRPPLTAPPSGSANASTRRCEARSRSRGDAGGSRSTPPPHLPQRSPSPDRSGDVAGGHSKPSGINFTVAHYVLTADAAVDDLAKLFRFTPANLVVVSYDEWKGPNATAREKMAAAWPQFNNGANPWMGLWLTSGAVFGKASRISSIQEKLMLKQGFHHCFIIECQIEASFRTARGSLMLGFFASASNAGPYKATWLESVCSTFVRERVRYICGIFWRPKSETEFFFKQLRACDDGLFFQPFWTDEPQDGFSNDEVAAVAAHFNVVAKNTKYVVVYPAYFVALGPSLARRPMMRQQPTWSDKLFPCGSSIEKGSRALTHVPQLRGEKRRGV